MNIGDESLGILVLFVECVAIHDWIQSIKRFFSLTDSERDYSYLEKRNEEGLL